MMQLLVKYRFQGFNYIVADGKGVFYQLPHCRNNYSRPFRKLNAVLNNGVTEGYRIDRKFVSLIQLRARAYDVHEFIDVGKHKVDLPF